MLFDNKEVFDGLDVVFANKILLLDVPKSLTNFIDSHILASYGVDYHLEGIVDGLVRNVLRLNDVVVLKYLLKDCLMLFSKPCLLDSARFGDLLSFLGDGIQSYVGISSLFCFW